MLAASGIAKGRGEVGRKGRKREGMRSSDSQLDEGSILSAWRKTPYRLDADEVQVSLQARWIDISITSRSFGTLSRLKSYNLSAKPPRRAITEPADLEKGRGLGSALREY